MTRIVSVNIIAELTFTSTDNPAFKFPIVKDVRISLWFVQPRQSTPCELKVTEPMEMGKTYTLKLEVLPADCFKDQFVVGNTFYLRGFNEPAAVGKILTVL